MSSTNTIEQDFIDSVSAKVKLMADGKERFRVLTPFYFDDGDQLVIILKKQNGRWILSDEAHTYMHLTYKIDKGLLFSGKRQQIILKALSMFRIEDRNGELVVDVSNGCYGNALYRFVQALLKITDVSYLSRIQVRSTFMQDFRTLLTNKVMDDSRMEFEWHYTDQDPKGNYRVNCRINGIPQPLFVYALDNDRKTRDATIALHRFREWELSFTSVGIFEGEDSTTRKVLTRFLDVSDEFFPNMYENYESIGRYLEANI